MVWLIELAVPLFSKLTCAAAVALTATFPKEILLVDRTTVGVPVGCATFDGPTQPVMLARKRTRQAKLKARARLQFMKSTSPLSHFGVASATGVQPARNETLANQDDSC